MDERKWILKGKEENRTGENIAVKGTGIIESGTGEDIEEQEGITQRRLEWS